VGGKIDRDGSARQSLFQRRAHRLFAMAAGHIGYVEYGSHVSLLAIVSF
jgi:hypothetical protein